ncbi:hypothetical protein GGI13_000591 [Coemansia sp. RSA 455]|nr:hypothetical protein GGI13_000591 [Coemansia sp. RSA 455]
MKTSALMLGLLLALTPMTLAQSDSTGITPTVGTSANTSPTSVPPTSPTSTSVPPSTTPTTEPPTSTTPTTPTSTTPTTPTTTSTTSHPTTPPTSDTDDVTITSIVTRTSFSTTPTSTTTSPTTTPPSSKTTQTSHTGKDGSTTDEPTPNPEPTSDTKTKDSSEGSNSKSLSSGAIAGIVIGALILAVGGVLGLLFWRRHKQKSQYAQKIDYAEFPEFNPSTSNNGLNNRPPVVTHMPYYSDKSNVAVGGTGSGPVAQGPSHGHPVSDPSLLRELDEA